LQPAGRQRGVPFRQIGDRQQVPDEPLPRLRRERRDGLVSVTQLVREQRQRGIVPLGPTPRDRAQFRSPKRSASMARGKLSLVPILAGASGGVFGAAAGQTVVGNQGRRDSS